MDVEHRCCLRHLYANLKGDGFKGKAFKDALWASTTATNLDAFKSTMIRIEVLYASAHRKLLELETSLWSRHAFDVGCKSDMLLNNLAKTFNTWIKDACDKPIATMLEMIHY